MKQPIPLAIDLFDAQEIVADAREIERNPDVLKGSALAAYFGMLGNFPNIDPKEQIEMAKTYRKHIERCVAIMDEIPGSIQFLNQVLETHQNKGHIESMILVNHEEDDESDTPAKEGFSTGDYFRKISRNGLYPYWPAWGIRVNVMLQWSRRLLEYYKSLKTRPWITNMPSLSEENRQALTRWYHGITEIESGFLQPANKALHYLNQLRGHTDEAEQIFNTLVECNLKLVIAVAKKYQNRGLSLEDLIQEGNLGLMRGIERYEPDSGNNPSTYIIWWIKQSIIQALKDKGYLVRLPSQVFKLLSRINEARREWLQTHMEEPTPKQIVGLLKTKGVRTSEENVSTALYCRQIYSIHQSFKPSSEDEEEYLLEQLLVGEEGVMLDERETQREAIEILLKNLNPQEQRVLTLRFGLATGYAQTLKEIGVALKVTKERIRQIENKALIKLRSVNQSNITRETV